MVPLLVVVLGLALPASPGDAPPIGPPLPSTPAPPPATLPAPSQAGAPSLRILRLDAAVARSLELQPSVREARATATAADARVTEARAPLLPQVTASASYQRIHGSSLGLTGTPGPGRGSTTTPTSTGMPTMGSAAAPAVSTGTATSTAGIAATGTYNYWSVGGSASQLLWDFGQAYERLRASQRAADAGHLTEKATELLTVFTVRRAFFLAAAYKALARVAADNLANIERHLTQVRGNVAAGTRPEIDLVQSKTDVANAKVQLITAANSYDLAKTQLEQAIGDAHGAEFDVADDTLDAVEGEDLPIGRLVPVAMNGRPELRALEQQEEAQRLTVRSAKGAYGPTLSAIAGLSEVGISPTELGPSWNVGATLAWPLFQGGLTHGVVREAEANLDFAHAQLEAERLQVMTDLEQASLALGAQKATLEAATEAEVNARERLRLAEGRYQSGVGSIIELGDAQVSLTTAAAQRVQAALNLATARAQLLYALGRR